MDFIKYFDCFNIKFSFYTNNTPNNQTLLGGIMSFLYLILCIFVFLFLSYDDLNRMNPITTMSEIPYSGRKLINMNKEKIWIPFRMVNYENQFLDHRKILYVVPYLIEGRYNESIGMDLKYTLLNYKFCNETEMINRSDLYKIDVPLNQLFCFDNDILFGGNWNYNYLNYLEINLYLCEDGVPYNASDPRCSKLVNFIQDYNSSLLFDFYFPTVQFQPNNLDKPVQIIYKNYYYRLSAYSYKIEKLYIRENIISDDKNLFKANYKNNSFWGKSNIYSDDYFLPNEFDRISNNSNTSRIYALNIYMDDGLVHYTRTFKKLFLIFSNLFPIFRCLLFVIKKFTQHIKMSLIKKKLIELIFENNKLKPKKFVRKIFENENNNLKDNQKNLKFLPSNTKKKEIINGKNGHRINFEDEKNNEKNEKFQDNNNNYNELKNNNIKYNNNILSYKINSSFNEEINKKDISITNLKGNQNSFYETLNLQQNHDINKIINNNQKIKSTFPYYYFFLDIIFDNLINPKKFCCLSKNYFTIYNFMCHIYDISSHIIFFKQFNVLNNISNEKIFEEIGFPLFNQYNKININDDKLLENVRKDIKNKKSILYNNYFL